ncbi:hypothetical protein SADUNF_Sadunf16G0095500 [Salix dunnii]|uniref:Uncharacterized protein n=1 Tax=Salix dunnii TaxID=1413687 RepID=A0A835MPT6_9ROSI|nr:hypothetical protein SADUNF_Sadunf16G0095500 [Salix dunnii]
MNCLIWAPKFGTVEGKVKTTVVCRKMLSQFSMKLAFEEGKSAPETPVGPALDPEEDSISWKLGSDGNLSIKSSWSSLRIKATKLIGCGVLFSYQNTLNRLSTEAEQLGWGRKTDPACGEHISISLEISHEENIYHPKNFIRGDYILIPSNIVFGETTYHP